jgi:hypothetical protein
MPGIIMLKSIFFLKMAPSVLISIPERDIECCLAVLQSCGPVVVHVYMRLKDLMTCMTCMTCTTCMTKVHLIPSRKNYTGRIPDFIECVYQITAK